MPYPALCSQVLSYLDFFPTSVQRTAVATAANMCRMLSTEDTSTVEEAIPMLTNLLQYQVRHQHSYELTCWQHAVMLCCHAAL